MKLVDILCFICIFYLFKMVFCEKKTLHCPFTDSLSGIDKIDQYDLVYVQKGDDVTIPCCQRSSESVSKSWSKQDRFMKQNATDLGEKEFWKISNNFELTIENFDEDDAGAYYCTDVPFNNEYNNYYYLIDAVLESPVIYGNLRGYKKFIEEHLQPIEEYLGNYRNNDELNSLYQKTGLKLSVNLRFEAWSPCDACKREKKRIGHCYLKPNLVQPDLCKDQCKILQFALSIDCRTTWTLSKILPNLAEKIKQVPDFGRVIKCVGDCIDEGIPVYVHKKYKLQRVPIGTTFELSCQDYSIRKKCHWTKSDIKLYTDTYDHYATVSVNEFCVLLIRKATYKEGGNYACYLDEKLVTVYKVDVYEEFSEKNAMWWRHMKYLLYIILLCFIVLVAGLVIGIMQRNSYEQIDVNEALEMFLRRRFDHEKLEPPSVS